MKIYLGFGVASVDLTNMSPTLQEDICTVHVYHDNRVNIDRSTALFWIDLAQSTVLERVIHYIGIAVCHPVIVKYIGCNDIRFGFDCSSSWSLHPCYFHSSLIRIVVFKINFHIKSESGSSHAISWTRFTKDAAQV